MSLTRAPVESISLEDLPSTDLHILNLPAEIINIICRYLPRKTCIVLRGTCKQMYEAILQDFYLPTSTIRLDSPVKLFSIPLKDLTKLKFQFYNFENLIFLKYFQITDIKGSHTKIYEIEIRQIVDNCDNLKKINFSGMNITDNCLKIICEKFKNLSDISIGRSSITDDGLKHIGDNCKDLIKFGNYNSQCCDGIKYVVQNCTRLQKINLYNTGANDDVLYTIGDYCKELKHMGLRGLDITEASVLHVIKNNKNLLTFITCSMLTGVAVKCLVTNCKKLQELVILDANVNDAGVQSLTEGCSYLETLDLRNNELTNKCIPFINKLTRLKRLYISGNAITRTGAMEICSSTLSHLCISGTILEMSNLECILSNCRSLKRIEVSFFIEDEVAIKELEQKYKVSICY